MMSGGRPTKLTPELQRTIVVAITGGNYIETAAAMAGVNKETLYAWLRRGAKEPGIYREFSDAVEKALAQAETRDVLLIGRAAETQWQAAAWRLERKFPQRWGRRDHLKLSVSDEDIDAEIEAELEKLAAGSESETPRKAARKTKPKGKPAKRK